MYELPKGQTTETERALLKKLRVWIAALAVACLVTGFGLGALLSGHPAVAQNEAQIARAPEALSASFAEIARRVEPAVVNINTVTAPQVADKSEKDEDEKEGPSDNPLLDMFRKHSRRPARGVGSGFIVDPKGYIVTNQHVVEDATRIVVRLQTKEELVGRVIGVDDETDIALVKVDTARDLPTVKLGNSDDVQVGDWVLAIGSPFGLEQTVTAGIISTRERQTTPGATFQRFLQTDAAINRGNSGGPLVNMRGEVIGVNSQIATSTGDYNGIGFALPANEAKFVYNQLASAGKVRRGYLGVYLDSVKGEFARVYGMPEPKGAIVTDVRDTQGPAAKAGIQNNDIVIEFNSQPISNSQDLIGKVASTPVGQTVPVAYLREVNGKLERRTTSVVLGERPPRVAEASPHRSNPSSKTKTKETTAGNRPSLGLTLSELTPQLANEKNLKGVRGLLVRDVDQSGIAYDAGIREDSVILRINRVPVTSLDEFQRFMDNLKPGDAIVMHLAIPSGDRMTQTIVQFTYQ